MNFTRFAVYLTPEPGDFARAGANWLGWDIATGTGSNPVAGSLAQRPQKYGFHGTIKPPFRLADGRSREQLQSAFQNLCANARPILLQGLVVTRIGGFLALTPTGDFSELADLAATAVSDLDPFRAPPKHAELAKRRKARLTPQQDAHLERWGYPYVFDQFRFHMTLTGPIPRADFDAALASANAFFAPCLPSPFRIASLTLVGERTDGMFQEIQRATLGESA